MFVVTLLHGTRTHTRSACIPPVCVRPLPEWPQTRAAAKSLHPRRSKINTDIPRGAKISVASTGLLPLCHRRRNTAQCTRLFSSRSVSRLVHTFFGGMTFTKARHKSHGDRTSSCDERRCVCAWIRCSHMQAGGLQPVPSCQFIGSSTEKRKRPIPDALIPTGSTNTLVASRHSSAHPGMPKSDVELSASNATISTNVGSTREDTQTTNNTLHMSPERHSDTPRHANRKYSSLHAPRTSASHTRQNKCSSDQWPPRAAVGSKQKRRAARHQKSATTGRNSTERSHTNEFTPNALSLPPSPQKLQKIENKRTVQ
ncbi:hypothetical protein TCSYLVIO_002229 [Trypanosoma cruzi]|nr:hypothetical protein TCSYLVIO_002229 [Trypanosoma cruzi]